MKRSKFSLSHYKLLTCKMGQLVPVSWFEALPGDTIQQAVSALVRCAPLVTPVMHPVQVRFHHWFVPNRLLWTNWQDFITGGADGNNASAHPYIDFGGAAPSVGTLADHLGVPTSGTIGRVNALPFRAYNLIWNEFYRDEDLQSLLNLSLADGADATTSVSVQNISWEKDYLTSSRPWALKGTAVTLPLGTSAPVKGIGVYGTTGALTAPQNSVRESGGGTRNYAQALEQTNIANDLALEMDSSSTTTAHPTIYADLSAATGIDINTVRHAFAIQRYQEARARYGSRYTEYLRAAFGVRSSDARLQRPEYLGGGRNTIQFSEVLQTGGTSAGAQTGVGQMAGHGITAMRSNRYRRFFEEHGIVMTLMSVRPRTMYSQRMKRAFMRGIGSGSYAGSTGGKEDYFQKELQHIGQQALSGYEVDSSTNSSVVFGYQDRYDEYRREESQVAGLFRSTLNTWHLSREFGGAPSLNSTFVSCVPSTRVFADTSADNLYVMANQSIQARRLVAREGTSSIL